MHERLIPEATVARMWRVTTDTVRALTRSAGLVPDEKERLPRGFTYHFLPSTLDAWLASRARGFEGSVPSVTQLLRPHGLLLPQEAATLLGKDRMQLRYGISQGYYPAFILSERHIVRLPATMIERISRVKQGLVSQDTARKVLCQVGVNAIRNLAKAGKLTCVRPDGQKELMVTYDSLMKLVAELLPHGFSPTEWWDRCTQDTELSVTKEVISNEHHMTLETLDDEMARGALPYIRTAGGHFKVPQWALNQFLAERNTLPTTTIALILGVEEAQAAAWINRRMLCTTNHGSAVNACPSRRCMVHYVERHRTTLSLSAEEWLTFCLTDSAAPYNSEELLLALPGMNDADLEEEITSGRLRALRLPNRQAAIVRSDALVFRRLNERRLYRDYRQPY
ncbi:MAG TPA: hypothetical protein VJM32_04935 [Candidatus Saccharimonadales bacterium]|nr:hypothetical protein [Candidatus Saccharimonadales bacterium]